MFDQLYSAGNLVLQAKHEPKFLYLPLPEDKTMPKLSVLGVH